MSISAGWPSNSPKHRSLASSQISKDVTLGLAATIASPVLRALCKSEEATRSILVLASSFATCRTCSSPTLDSGVSRCPWKKAHLIQWSLLRLRMRRTWISFVRFESVSPCLTRIKSKFLAILNFLIIYRSLKKGGDGIFHTSPLFDSFNNFIRSRKSRNISHRSPHFLLYWYERRLKVLKLTTAARQQLMFGWSSSDPRKPTLTPIEMEN